MSFVQKHKVFLIALAISLSTYILFIGNFLLPNYYFWGSDAQVEYVPAREYFYQKVVNEHTFPFWTEKMYLGFPIYADSENGYLNPINVLSILIFGPTLSYKILHLSFYLIGSLSLFYLLKRKDIGIAGYGVSNVIFYFSTFMINHQIHFNIILTFYLFPAMLYLVDLFLEKPKFKYIFLESLIISFSILYGHVQSSLIVCFGMVLYFLIYSYKNFDLKRTLSFGLFLALLILIQTLPQIIPTREIYNQSFRGTHLDLYQGSYLPTMVSFAFLPNLFGIKADYIGNEVNATFSYTEIYIYAGLSSAILALFGIIFTKFTKLNIFSYMSILIFVIFATLKYSEIFTTETPIIGLFRYWERTFVLGSFGIAIIAGQFVNQINKIDFKNFYIRLALPIVPTLFIYSLLCKPIASNLRSLIKINEYISFSAISVLSFSTTLYLIFGLTLFFVLGTIVLNFYKVKSQKYLKYLQIPLVLVIFFDLFYFNQDVTAFRLKNTSDYKLPQFAYESSNERAVYMKYNIIGLEYLKYPSWSPFGYSQFVESDYMQFMLDKGFPALMGTHIKMPAVPKLQALGVTNTYFQGKAGFNTIPHNQIELFQNKVDGKYLQKEEGLIQVEYNVAEPQYISTFIKFSPSWVIRIDGKEVENLKKDIFLKFYTQEGKHVVTFEYVPESFYKGLYASLILLIISIPTIWLAKKFKWVL
jgi:hypothetical protein